MRSYDARPEALFLKMIEEEAVVVALKNQAGPERFGPLMPGKGVARFDARRGRSRVRLETCAQGLRCVGVRKYDGLTVREQREKLGLGQR